MARIKENFMWPYAMDRTSQVNQYLADKYFEYHKDRIYRPPVNKYVVVKTAEGDRVERVETITVHEFSMGDVEDPDLYAAQPLYDWEHSEQGQWVMRNAVDTPAWHRIADHNTFGYKYQITAKLTGPALTEWLLRYGR